MRNASVRDLRIRTSELAREAAEDLVIQIKRRGEPVAELRPLPNKQFQSQLPDLTELWDRLPAVPGDRGMFLEEGR